MSRTSQTIINSFEILGTVALHFLWQGTLVGIIYYLLRFIVRRASTRAGLALAAIVLMLVLPILTIGYIEKPLGEMSSMAVWKISIGVIWIIGASCLLSRFIPGFLKLNRLRQPGNYIEDEVAGQFEQLKTKFHFRRNITLLLHEAIKVPITFGFWKPVIIMPMSALSGLPGDQIELVLAHELSHIRRNDYLWNLVQTLAESCLFFHPAVWLISKDLRKEREYACDDYVVRLYEDRTTYANALANMESQRQTNLAMAANGSEFSLLGRIRRILDEDSDPGSDRRRLTGELMSVILNASIKVRGPVSKEPDSSVKTECPQSKTANQWNEGLSRARKETVEQILSMSESDVKFLALEGLSRRWVEKDLEAAWAFGTGLEKREHFVTFMQAVAPMVSEKHPDKIFSIIEAGRHWPGQWVAIQKATMLMADRDLDRAVHFYTESTPERLRFTEVSRQLARRIVMRDGSAEPGFAFAATLRNQDKAYGGALQGILQEWVKIDEDAAMAYARDFEHEKFVSRVVSGLMAGTNWFRDPENAIKWTTALTDETLRRRCLSNLVWLWQLKNRPGEITRLYQSELLQSEDRVSLTEEMKKMGIPIPQ